MRAFIALPLPEPFRLALAAARAELLKAAPRELSGARWVRPEAMHVTLAFLGELGEAEAWAAEEALRAAVGAAGAPTSLAARGSGRAPGRLELGAADLALFPPRGRATVIAAAIGPGAAEAAALASAVEDALEAAGRAGPCSFRPREERPFRPHVTLARVPRPGAALRAQASLVPIAASCAVDRVALFSSTLGPGGPRYEVLAEVGLEG